MDNISIGWLLKNQTMILLNIVLGVLGCIGNLSIIHKYNGIPVTVDWDIEFSILFHLNVHIDGRSVVNDWPSMTFPGSTNDFNFASFFLKKRNLIFGEFLIFRVFHFLGWFQIEPQLEAKRVFIKGAWHFRMDNSFSGGHPLYVTRTDDSFMPLEIFVIELSWFHIGDSFESPMRVIRETSWESNFEVVEHQERV